MRYGILIDHQEYGDDIDEISFWTEHHPILYSSYSIAHIALKKLIKEELFDLVASRGNYQDYSINETEDTIYDGETGYDIPVSHYRIVEFKEGL